MAGITPDHDVTVAAVVQRASDQADRYQRRIEAQKATIDRVIAKRDEFWAELDEFVADGTMFDDLNADQWAIRQRLREILEKFA